jgi:hypothetical protein
VAAGHQKDINWRVKADLAEVRVLKIESHQSNPPLLTSSDFSFDAVAPADLPLCIATAVTVTARIDGCGRAR